MRKVSRPLFQLSSSNTQHGVENQNSWPREKKHVWPYLFTHVFVHGVDLRSFLRSGRPRLGKVRSGFEIVMI